MRLSTCFLTAFTAAAVWCTAASADDPVNDFALPSAADDAIIRLSDYSGKVVLIHWFRTTSDVCRRQTPWLKKLYGQYHNQGLEIIGVCADPAKTADRIPAFVKERGITWPVGLMDHGEFRREVMAGQHDSLDVPANYLVARDGEIRFLGVMADAQADRHAIEDAIVPLLDEPAPDHPAIEPRQFPKAPEFVLDNIEGEEVHIHHFTGQPVVVHFFDLDNIDRAAQAIAKIHQQYAGRGLHVVGIDVGDDASAVRRYLDEREVQYPVLISDSKTRRAWLGSNRRWGVFFVTGAGETFHEGTLFKKIVHWPAGGIASEVFTKHARHLVRLYEAELRQLAAPWAKLTPGESTREQVEKILGEPEWEYWVETAPGYVRVRLPEHNDRLADRIARDHRAMLRVLRYEGDERRDFYAAVLKNNRLHYTVGPVPPGQNDLFSLRFQYGPPKIEKTPEMVLHNLDDDTRRMVNVVKTAWYPRRGLAFITGPDDEGFTAKLRMEPRQQIPRQLDEQMLRDPSDDRGDITDVTDQKFLQELFNEQDANEQDADKQASDK